LSGLDDVDPGIVLETVIGEAEKFTGGTLHDDVALLAIQRLAGREAVPKQEFQV
jgi:hypothetical protein